MLKIAALFLLAGLAMSLPVDKKNPMFNEDLFEGDIAGINGVKFEKGLGHLPDGSYGKWPAAADGSARCVIPWNYGSTYSAAEQATIAAGLKAIEDRTRINGRDCIRFVSRTSEPTYIQVIRGSGCWSYVGMQSTAGIQQLSIGNGCVYNMIVAHEFMHALGIWHEQSRPDRDAWVTINLSVVASNLWHNFNKYETGITLNDTPYDILSIMHYENTAFSQVSGVYSITANNGQPLIPTWQKNDLTDVDVTSLRNYYNCQ